MSPNLDSLLKGLSPGDMADMLALLDELDDRKRMNAARADFLAFIALMDPTYKFGTHLKRLGGLLMDTENGVKDRVAVSMAPRFGKSQMISIYFPAWYLGRNPEHKVIVASHTADLAITMARKVRNLMQTPQYRKVFPGVAIAADAKAAGKWNTNKGGEYMAVGVGGALAGYGGDLCCVPETLVWTAERGRVEAGSVSVGEHLLSWHGWAEVQAKITPEHEATVTLAGRLRVSTQHPIWTLNRGWVPAGEIQSTDLLWSMTLFGTIRAHLLGALYGKPKARPIPDQNLQHLGSDAAALHQSESRQLHILRRGWDYCVRAVEELCAVLPGYGTPTNRPAYAGPDRQRPGVQPGELPLGGRGHAAKQPNQRSYGDRIWGNQERDSMGAGHRADQGYGCASAVCAGDVARGSAASASDEPQQARHFTEVPGWFRRSAARVIGRCGALTQALGVRHNQESALDGSQAWEWTRRICGLLLGVRSAGPVRVEHHAPRQFVNFMVGGDHTFVGDSILSHNCIIDDPLSEQDIKSGNFDSLDVVYEWFRAGLRTRLMPGGRIVVLHTRWHQRDLIGRLLKDTEMDPDGDQYEMFEFPAILNYDNTEDHPTHPPKSLWPEQWSLEALLRTKASMPLWQWNAQYMQDPTAADSAIIKREWIKWWQAPTPPQVDFIVQSWDTALTTKERSDWSVCQTWGVWTDERDGSQNVILLNNAKGKWEFPDLKEEARRQYENWSPDSVIIEAKASGQPLIDEMRRSGIFVQDFSPGKGNDKIARVNAISDMFAEGRVWFPETAWAQEVVEELIEFPSALHDDQVDALSLALRRVRKGGLLRLNSDPADNWEPEYRRRKGAYTV